MEIFRNFFLIFYTQLFTFSLNSQRPPWWRGSKLQNSFAFVKRQRFVMSCVTRRHILYTFHLLVFIKKNVSKAGPASVIMWKYETCSVDPLDRSGDTKRLHLMDSAGKFYVLPDDEIRSGFWHMFFRSKRDDEKCPKYVSALPLYFMYLWFIYLTTISVAQAVGLLVNNELEMTWKEAVMP